MIINKDNYYKQGVRKSTGFKQIAKLALKSLPRFFDKNQFLFYFKAIKKNNQIIKEGSSIRYTLISLLGLVKASVDNIQSIEIKHIIHNQIQNRNQIASIGDLGLLLWLCSIAEIDKTKTINALETLLLRLKKSKEYINGHTMEMAWCLIGICYFRKREIKTDYDIKLLSTEIYTKILNNYKFKGIFGHLSSNNFKGIIRGRIGSFADQVYPIYALSLYSETFSIEEPLIIALECGERICNAQGQQGQWWWHYNSLSGKTVGRYPVYSVHQDAMAPMGLMKLQEVSGKGFASYIDKGLEYIIGFNELDKSMIDFENSLIWRCIKKNKTHAIFEEFKKILSIEEETIVKRNDLILLEECWSYHLGWILYVFGSFT